LLTFQAFFKISRNSFGIFEDYPIFWLISGAFPVKPKGCPILSEYFRVFLQKAY